MDEFFSRDAARHYNTMGGIMGGENVASLRDGALTRDLKALEKKGYITSKLAIRSRIRCVLPKGWRL